MSLTVRYPHIPYENCFPMWSPHMEFAVKINAISLMPNQLEPYVIRVFQEALKLLDPVQDKKLLDEVNWFIAQESQHYRQHAKFNRMFEGQRYAKALAENQKLGELLEHRRKARSLLFNLAYTEGFESGGGIFFSIWFNHLSKYRFGAKQEALLLFDWHFAEEYEHREIAFKLYNAIAARGNIFRRVWYRWIYRMYATAYYLADSAKLGAAITREIMCVEREGMSDAEVAASNKREREIDRDIWLAYIPGVLNLMSPFYDPANKKPPVGHAEILRQFEPGGAYGKPVTAA